MSHYSTVELEIRDKQILIQTLEAMRFKPQIFEEAKNLYGYLGDKRSQTAEIIVRRRQISRDSNDLGFKWNGRAYEMIVSDYDRSIIPRFNKEYAKLVVQQQAQRLGLVVAEKRLPGGGVQFTLSSASGEMSAEVLADGTIKVGVHGVSGAGCLQFSQALESALGEVRGRQETEEFYAQQNLYSQNQQQIGY
jgi:hypothetical protein